MIGRKDVEYIAELARLELSESEIESFSHQLATTLTYIEQLNQVDTDQVEPTAFLAPEHDPLRDDVAQPSLPSEQALRNGPKVTRGCFAIPKVIEQ
jgi:aspartyl-tRNA(Asn)/glutamyl-tRNA(Gln) amidotransferase subunit C